MNPASSPGVYFTKIVCGCACRTLKIWLSLYQFFCLISHSSVYTTFEKHPTLTKLGDFYNNLSKIHPIYVIWAHLSLMKPPIAIPNFAKKHPKRQAHIRTPSQCERTPQASSYLANGWTWTHQNGHIISSTAHEVDGNWVCYQRHKTQIFFFSNLRSITSFYIYNI